MTDLPITRSHQRIEGVHGGALTAVLHDLCPLVYHAGGSHTEDVPDHVRAASAVRRSNARLVIVQDDVSVLALHHETSRTEAVLLPACAAGRRTFDEGRGNKHAKMDLEACAVLPDGRLVAFGSGSTGSRERLVLFDPAGELRIVQGRELYALLRAETRFAGSELNVEGALVVGSVLKLFQRGNGAVVDGRTPVNATCDLLLSDFIRWLDTGAAALAVSNVVQYDLGQVGDVPFTFTDAALMRDGRIGFVACAEASPDTFRDGEVLGCRFGILAGEDVRLADILHAEGQPTVLKLEGLECRPDSDVEFDVVVDRDRPDEPALLGRLVVSGGAPAVDARAPVTDLA